ncbi:hypothetical protein T02_12474 [Trichinella nativa]|uniref:Uncharacterized protein n=1 Tax=Trichinella nativa TaxID=6335 RepID=A0A0V1LUH2_9BILA|nr:hypothetical protein T02_12474 [Trichinella nativa]
MSSLPEVVQGMGPTSVVFHGSLISRLRMPWNFTTALKRGMQTFLPLAQCQNQSAKERSNRIVVERNRIERAASLYHAQHIDENLRTLATMVSDQPTVSSYFSSKRLFKPAALKRNNFR